jgi:hypothetical protein
MPTIPSSSLDVIKASKGPCFNFLLAKIAKITATAIPLSAPNVVSLA